MGAFSGDINKRRERISTDDFGIEKGQVPCHSHCYLRIAYTQSREEFAWTEWVCTRYHDRMMFGMDLKHLQAVCSFLAGFGMVLLFGSSSVASGSSMINYFTRHLFLFTTHPIIPHYTAIHRYRSIVLFRLEVSPTLRGERM